MFFYIQSYTNKLRIMADNNAQNAQYAQDIQNDQGAQGAQSDQDPQNDQGDQGNSVRRNLLDSFNQVGGNNRISLEELFSNL